MFKLNEIAENLKQHKFFASEQRESFRKENTNIAEDEILVVMDFKENIRLGGGPIETGNDFYRRQQCSIFGIGVVFYDQVIKQRRLEYIDFFSDILSHDALFVKDCLNKVLNFYINLRSQSSIKKVNFWNDSGRHFQCGELAHFLLKIVPFSFNVQVSWNFFGEHHGKNILDGHFGLLSRTIKNIERRKYIRTIQDLIGFLQEEFSEINSVRTNKGVKVFFHIYERESRAKYINILNIKNLCDFYYFESFLSNDNISIRAKVYKNSSQVTENLKVSTKRVEDKRTTKRGSEAIEETRGKKKSFDINCIDNVFGRVVRGRNQRRKELGLSTEQVSSKQGNLGR